MQWNLRLTHPSIQHIKTDQPPRLFALLWLIGLFLACGCAGAAGAIVAIPTSVLVFSAIAIMAIVWLATYSWVFNRSRTHVLDQFSTFRLSHRSTKADL
jgi:hypothetical protein